CFERNWKVVDGDLPSIGWLGEMMMRNPAQDGPLTSVNDVAQPPTTVSYKWVFASKLDTHAKFDLFRPFRPVQKYSPTCGECRTENLHMLDIFTVWDPSNDRVDNDGDGAVDDEDTGNQAGDRCGPEVRVFGRVDLNQAPDLVAFTPMPDNKYMSTGDSGPQRFASDLKYSRGSSRVSETWMWGPFETLGDLIRADAFQYAPATYFSRGTAYEGGSGGSIVLNEKGYATCSYSNPMGGDDDGDGTCDERDERDMVFTWIANHFTTRSNVFDVDLVVETCNPPYYPRSSNTPRKLPFRTYKTDEVYARKHLLGILDRSTCLRIGPDGRCEFTGPVDVRMLRFTDEKRVW
ncbi:MAG TPA: hypothetical protein VMX57_00625, partial [Planctomycetota bacterium]|nr:hypothetical protein [Planctomycetota bacterium]